MEGLILDKFIVDGYHYDYMPGSFEQEQQAFAVRAERYPVLSGNTVVVIQAPTPTVFNPLFEGRKLRRQAWKAMFDHDSWMDICMYDHLRTLYTLQKSFWLQFDDEMSRCWARLYEVSNDHMAYFTPTYPIAPFGYTPLNGQVFNGTVRVNGVVYTAGYDVDVETGMVRFHAPLSPTDIVEMQYTWKCYVRIAEWEVNPTDLAQHTYVGAVLFEQITPNFSSDPWYITNTCNICVGPTDPSETSQTTGGTDGTLLSLPTDGTYAGSDPSAGSGASGGSGGSGSSGSSGGGSGITMDSGVIGFPTAGGDSDTTS